MILFEILVVDWILMFFIVFIIKINLKMVRELVLVNRCNICLWTL